ncbi:MAG: Hpt domain-containing protein [Treponema sp.]|jgi:two-component system chemotaxis sensor kinase CheA|nr:Hpt domain-containing protein [Treponema sp.]
MPQRKPGFASLFTIISLTGIVLITISLSLLSFINFRTITYNQIETALSENINRLHDTVTARFNAWSTLIERAAIEVAPFIGEEPVDIEHIVSIISQIQSAQSDVWTLYCCSNILWSQSGGFLIYNDGRLPPENLDNTERVWFRNAKANPGTISYTEPFMSNIGSGDHLTISVSANVYDEAGRDLGVVAGNVSIDALKTILADITSLPQQQVFLLNKDGYFITSSEAETTNYFDESKRFIESNLKRYRDNIIASNFFFKRDKDIFVYSLFIPEVNWILVSTVPTSVVFTKINGILFKMIGIILGLVVIAVVMSIIMTRILQNERDENAAMRDNLNIGFFLIDQNYIIRGQYSRVLEQVFCAKKLKGKNFVNLVSLSLAEKEITALKDYFDMVINRSFDQDLLDEINPIQELSYIAETGEEKTLSCGFAAVERGRKETFILGNILDITTEKQLKDQLVEEEAKRQENMRFLFEVIQTNPEVLHDFMEEMEDGFDQINSILTDDDVTPEDAVVSIYQSIHAVKSNAVILGLKTFGEKLHNLESTIKIIREQEAVCDEDLGRILVEMKQIKRDRGKLLEALQKIQSFKTEGKRSQGEYVLLESLTRACNKVSADLDKNVAFVVKEIDPRTIMNGPRRAMKEVLMQLIRNAVYHGIETPKERAVQGKDETGVIALSITLDGDWIHIQLSDNGKGLDFAKIQAKAKQLRLISQDDEAETDPDQLLQVIFAPGFSTAEEEGMHAGRGIGLNLVQDRIQELGGTIKVHSEYQKGTVFIISIPMPVVAFTQTA